MAAEWSWHFRIFGESEAGIVLQGAFIEDVDRLAKEDTYGFMAGLGLFIDLRLGDFQVDVRAGWSPTLDQQSGSGQFGVFLAGGWQWD